MSQIVPKPVGISNRAFRHSRRRRRRWRHHRGRKWLNALARWGPLVAILLIALAGLSLIPALAARRHMEDGRVAIESAQSQLLHGSIDQAHAGYADAQTAFEEAVSDTNSPFIRIASFLPVAGRTPDALRALADIGLRISTAGNHVSSTIADMPGGMSSLAPTDGKIPLSALSDLAPVVHDARVSFYTAAEEADGIARSLVVGPVAEAGDLVRRQLDGVIAPVRAADELLRAFPQFAGQDTTRRYFLAAENPTELRGTGGLISSYAVLTIKNGRISVSPFEDIHALKSVREKKATWPSRDFEQVYAPFNSAGDWRGTNVTPDVPTAASLIESLWKQQEGSRIDGTVFVDIQELKHLVGALGQVPVPELGSTLTERTTVPYVANTAYSTITDGTQRKHLLGIVGQQVFEEFLARASGYKALRALVQAAANGDLLVHSTDGRVETGFLRAGVGGRFGPEPGGDFFSPVVNNIGGNKIDYYVKRNIDYQVALLPDGAAAAHARIAFDNTAPAGRKPSYVLGPFEGKDLAPLDLRPGEAYESAFYYCGSGCRLASASADGKPMIAAPYEDAGLSMFSNTMRIKPHTTRRVDLTMKLATAWNGNGAEGTYSLRLQNQPTIQPTNASVVIRVPAGMHITWASEPLQVQGAQATWSGELGDTQSLEVHFERGFVGRVWARVTDFLSQPVVRL